MKAMPDPVLRFNTVHQQLSVINEMIGTEKGNSFAKRLSEIEQETNADETTAVRALDDLLAEFPTVRELLQRSRPDLFVDQPLEEHDIKRRTPAPSDEPQQSDADGTAPMTRGTRPAPQSPSPPTGNAPGGAEPAARAASAEQWTPQTCLQLLKEIVTAVIGLLLVGSTVAMAFDTFNLAGSGAKVADAKNILIMMMGLAGVATGYYFGRVPADARANQSESRARAATAHAARVMAKSAQIVDQAETISSRSVTRAGAPNDNDTRSLRTLRAELGELMAAGVPP
jgi:hypothetical protein